MAQPFTYKVSTWSIVRSCKLQIKYADKIPNACLHDLQCYALADDEELGKPVTKPTKLGCFEKLPKRVQELVTDSDWESLWCGCAFFLLALLLGLSGAFEGTDIRPQAVQRSLCAPCATVERLLAQIEADISRIAAL
jgi:hypothetical protein